MCVTKAISMLEQINDILQNTVITLYGNCKLLISFLLGAVIGIERQFRRREAGMRTFTLICMGSTAAMLVSIWIPQCYPNFLNGDPGRIAAQVLSGIGFLGAGAIIQSHGSVHGLTTAACIWVMAVIGLAVGAGMYIPAAIATVITLFILVSLERLEKRMFLNGVNKILAITCSTATPDLKAVRKILESKGVFIVSVSFETFYKEDRSVITYKVNVKAISSYTNLFNEIRSLGIVTQIRLMHKPSIQFSFQHSSCNASRISNESSARALLIIFLRTGGRCRCRSCCVFRRQKVAADDCPVFLLEHVSHFLYHCIIPGAGS